MADLAAIMAARRKKQEESEERDEGFYMPDSEPATGTTSKIAGQDAARMPSERQPTTGFQYVAAAQRVDEDKMPKVQGKRAHDRTAEQTEKEAANEASPHIGAGTAPVTAPARAKTPDKAVPGNDPR